MNPEPTDLPVVRNDLLIRLQRRVGLAPADGLGVVRRAVFWSLLAWLPLAVWAYSIGRAVTSPVGEPLLAHFATHARFLVALPLLILAEGVALTIQARILPRFIASGSVAPNDVSRFRAIIADVRRLNDVALPWAALAAVAIALFTLPNVLDHPHEIDWAIEGEGAARRFGFGAWWFVWVARPIFLVVLLGTLWRALMLFVLMQRVARLDLVLVPTHPDRLGGLGFVGALPTMFAPVVLAIGAILASAWGHDLVYHGSDVLSLRIEIAAFVAIALILFAAPLLPLIGPLRRAKRQGLVHYADLVSRHDRLVHARWIEGRPVGDDPLLSAPELGPVADIATLYDSVKRMRTIPIGKATLAPLAIAAVAPMVALIAVEVPLKTLVLNLLKALI